MTAVDSLPDLHAGGDIPNRETRRAAGFRRERRHFRLRFEDDSLGLNGLVAVVRSVPVGTMLDLVALSELADQASTVEGLKAVDDLFKMLGGALVEWNLEDELCVAHNDTECQACGPDGEVMVVPVPATAEGVRSLDMDQAQALAKKWMEAAAGVAGPLGPASTAGKQSALQSLTMDPLASHPNWPEPS